MLPYQQDNTWDSLVNLKELLHTKGWFKTPPKKSMLRQQPACAWLTAGRTDIDQRSKWLPALHKDVLRKAIKRWIEVHFFLPVAGFTLGDNTHVNMMEPFVTFVWAYYTLNHKPVIPALTDVGRFMFTYIWRSQHSLFRCALRHFKPGVLTRYLNQVLEPGT